MNGMDDEPRSGGSDCGEMLVVCVGNELAADDGVGIRIGQELAALQLPRGVRVRCVQELGFDLLDALTQAGRLVIVDAASTGRPPGTCFELQPAELEEVAASTQCGHALGLGALLRLARRLEPNRALAEVYLVCVEGETFTGYSTELSPQVAAAIPEAVDHVLRLVPTGR